MSYQSCSTYVGIGYSVSAGVSAGLEQRLYSTQDAPQTGYHVLSSLPHLALYAGSDADQSSYHKPTYLSVNVSITPEYAFMPDAFLKPNRRAQPFVGDAAAVEEDVKDAFFATVGEKFPEDIRIAVLSGSAFSKQISHHGVVGFSINRKELGLVSDVVVRAAQKDQLLLTIGHEIGHVMTKRLMRAHDEEAKAFAFSRAWMQAIKKENIAGLRGVIVLDNPARNGLHDVASAFVWRMIDAGRDALQLYWDLVCGTAGVPHVI